jgi:hypothetical protein
MNIIYPYTIYVDKGRLPKGENTGKFQAGNRYTNELSKRLGRIPAWKRGISGKTLVCEQEH